MNTVTVPMWVSANANTIVLTYIPDPRKPGEKETFTVPLDLTGPEASLQLWRDLQKIVFEMWGKGGDEQ
jgi:hypothetical protein